jgi:hypothetical protein
LLLVLVLLRPRQMMVSPPLPLVLPYLLLPLVQLLLEVLLLQASVQQAALLRHLPSLQEQLQALLLLPAVVAQPSAVAAAAQAALVLALLLAALAETATWCGQATGRHR